MRILNFAKTFASPTMTFIYNEIISLSQSNDVCVATLVREREDLFPYDHIEILEKNNNTLRNKILHTLRGLDYQFAFSDKILKQSISNLVDKFKPDIIHGQFGFESWWLFENLGKPDVPIFLTLHGFDASHKLRSDRYIKMLKYYRNKLDLNIIFVSEDMKKRVVDVAGNFPNSFILYYGVDTQFFNRIYAYPSKEKKMIFLQISSFTEKKGHKYTILAFKEFHRQNPTLEKELILAGEGLLKEEMIDLVNSLGLADIVSFPGLVNKDQAVKLLNQCHVFVHHSVTSQDIGDKEGIPNAIMEAMACELPILSTFHAGIPELVEDKVNGLLVGERDIFMYAKTMAEISSWSICPQNRKKVEDKFEKSKRTKLLVSYYQQALAKNNKISFL